MRAAVYADLMAVISPVDKPKRFGYCVGVEDREMSKAMTAGRCSECGARVVAWERKGIKSRLIKLLAMADHLKTLHGLR